MYCTPTTTVCASFSLFHFVTSSYFRQGRCSRENCKYLHPPPHLKTQLEINGRNNLIQQKNMAMLAQQMQLANAMIPGTQLPPMVRGHTRMNIPQLMPMVRAHTCKSSDINSSFTLCVALLSLSVSPSLFPRTKGSQFVVLRFVQKSFYPSAFILLSSSPCSRCRQAWLPMPAQQQQQPRPLTPT